MNLKKFSLNAFLLGASVLFLLPQETQLNGAEVLPGETAEEYDARMKWWREAKFGMFIHWGLYAEAAGRWNGEAPAKGRDQRGEWLMEAIRMPVADYAKMAETFNPVEFDADEWIRMAKYAGCKYIVFTAKHHDGFAMYDTQASDYDIVDGSPFGRDVLHELAEACEKHGIKLGIYYSQTQDWYHPGGFVYKEGPWDPIQTSKSFDHYLETVALPQVEELLTRYGDVAELWWDTPGHAMTYQRTRPFADLVAKHQPQVIMNNRLGGGFEGDISTPEGHIPATGYPNRDWESCIPMAATWGYKSDVTSYHSSRHLITNLIDVSSKGGNLLLNISPMGNGAVPKAQIERMNDIGDWMKYNREAIYGSKPTIFGAEAGTYDLTKTDRHGNPKFIPGNKWRCTTSDSHIYIHFLQWPGKTFTLEDVPNKVVKAYILADPEKRSLEIKQEGRRLSVNLPQEYANAMIPVLGIEVEGSLNRPDSNPLAQKSDGTLTLEAQFAEIRNDGGSIPTLKLEARKATDWSKPEDHLTWNARLNEPGTYKVYVRKILKPDGASATFKTTISGHELVKELSSTHGGKPRATVLGTVTVDETGIIPVTFESVEIGKRATMRFESLLFAPVE